MAALTYFLILALISKEIASWTVDLPEARKYFFEKNEKYEHKRKDNTEKIVYAQTNTSVDKKDFDNIIGDSPANTKDRYFEQDHSRHGEYKSPDMVEVGASDDSSESEENGLHPGRYADEYGYQSYMEQKVAHVVHNGTAYLEGLRRALEQYGELLTNCSRNNSSRSTSSQSSTSTPSSTSLSSSISSSLSSSVSTPSSLLSSPSSLSSSSTPSSTWQPQNELPEQPRSDSEDERCERATRESERIRRLAALALWATRELQDKAYADKYQKDLDEQQEEEEKELLLRLAWFLDRLAHLTGYEPNAEDFISPSTPRTTTVPLPDMSPLNPNSILVVFQPASMSATRARDRTDAVRDCLSPQWPQSDSDRARAAPQAAPQAAGRCRLPLPLPLPLPLQAPEEIARMINSKDSSSSAVSRTSRSYSIETATQAESSDRVRAKSLKKRSVNDSPLVNIMTHYAKFKAWSNSNNNQEQQLQFKDNSVESFEQNYLNDINTRRNIKKRAIDAKTSTIHNSLKPEDPMQDISQYVKHKSGVHYVKDDVESEKIKMYLDKIRHSDSAAAKALVKRFQKRFKSVKKRSVKHYRKFQPNPAQDPQQDISYYVKNRRGTNYNYNQVQARQVRAGLEQIFQSGNIATARRYAANYNPAVPNTNIAGALRTMEDF